MSNALKYYFSILQECLKDIEIKPPSSENAMLSMLAARPYWCISRQRVWGVPIPVFYHKDTEKPLFNRYISQLFIRESNSVLI